MYIKNSFSILRPLFMSAIFASSFFFLIPTANAAIVSGTSSTGNNGSDGNTTLTINKPTAMVAGEVLVAEISFDKGASTAVSAPSGWNLIRRTDNGKKIGLATYWKLAGASEPSSYTWTISPSARATGGIVRYSGVQSSSPIDTTSDATGNSSTASAPSITTSVSNEQVVAVFTLEDNRSIGTSAGMTEKFDVSNPSSDGPALSFDDMSESAAGSTGASSATLGMPVKKWVSQRFALIPTPPVATLKIIKVVLNDNLGTSTPSDFSFQVNSGTTTPFNSSGENDLILSPGTYTVTEPSSARYAANYNNCTNVVISAGNTVTCTITNDDTPGALLTVRTVIGSGPAVPSDFFLSVASTSVQSGEQNLFPVGTYTVSENGPSGYRAEFGGDCDSVGSVGLGLNEIKTCTITNLIIENTFALCTDGIDNDLDGTTDLYDSDCAAYVPRLHVIMQVPNDNGGTQGLAVGALFAGLITPSGGVPGATVGNPPYGYEYAAASTTFLLNPGSYHVDPQVRITGYDASESSDCVATIAPGEVKTCTVTFDDVSPVLTVIKHVINRGGATSVASDFSMQVSGISASPATFPGDESGTIVTLHPGSYSVANTGPSGYFESMSPGCSGSIGLGETKACTITSSDVELTENTLSACTDGIDNDENGATDLYDSSCQAFVPRLNVIMLVPNDNGGNKGLGVGGLFAGLITPAGDIPGTTVGNSPYGYEYAAASTTFQLNPGSYQVDPQVRYDGYEASRSSDCVATIAAGETKTCTVTFDDIAPRLTVVKHVINSNEGTATASDFTISVAGTNVSTSSFPGSEGGTVVTLNQGSYSITNSGPSGYFESSSANCSGNISLGESKTCTITSSDVELVENTFALCTDAIDNDADGTTDLYDSDCAAYIPRLNVLMLVPNDSGGTQGLGVGALFAGLITPSGGVPGATIGNSPYGYEYAAASTTFLLNPGSYHVDPQARVNGYEASRSSDCVATIAAGETKTCTITFDDVSPVLTVIKHVNNNNGGTAAANSFTMDVSGTNVSNASFAGSESGTIATLNAGLYNVSESSLSGYTELTGTNCSGSLSLGETRTCTIVNDDIPPALILINSVINNSGGSATTTDWTLSATGPTSISGAGNVTSETNNNFTAGTYTLSQSGGPSGYTASQWSCVGDVTNSGNSITIGIGQNATCTIVNDDN